MKPLLLLLSLLLTLPAAAQRTKAQRIDSVADVFIADQKYDQAITTLYHVLEVLESPRPDSLYIAALVKMGVCYDLEGVQMKAIESTKRALDIYGEMFPAEDLYKAGLYDYLGVYYHKMRNYREAYDWSQRSVKLYEQLASSPADRVSAFAHAAAICTAYKLPHEGVRWQEKSAELAKTWYGGHSDQYLEQLGSLKRICVANGEQRRADRIGELHAQIARENREGFLPDDADLSTPALCRRHNRDALGCSRWLLKHYFYDPQMKQASSYIIRYCKQSPDVIFYFGPIEKKWKKHTVTGYLIAYMAASVEYALTHPSEPRYSVEQYKFAYKRLIDYYLENKKQSGSVAQFETYLKLRDKGGNRLDEQLAKDFEEYKDYMATHHGTDIEVENLTMLGAEF